MTHDEVSLTAKAAPWRAAANRGANLVFWLWFAALGVLLVFLAVAWLIGWRVDIVQTGSMAPTIPEGSVAVIAPVAGRAVQEGDVVRFRQAGPEGGRLVLHRVVAVVENEGGRRSFTTQGDANRTPDPRPITESAITGRMVFHVPKLGSVLLALREPTGLVLLIGLPLAAGVASLLWSRRTRA